MSLETIEVGQPKIGALKAKRWAVSEPVYVLWAAALLTFWVNSPYWYRVAHLLGMKQGSDWLFLASQMGLVWALTVTLLSVLCWWRWFKPMLALLFVISIMCAYFSQAYQIYIDRHMLANVMQTDVHEAKGLLSWALLRWMIIYGTPVAILLGWVSKKPLLGWNKMLLWHVGGAVLGVVLGLAMGLPMYKHYASLYRNQKQLIKMLTPFNAISASLGYAQHAWQDGHRQFEHVGLDAKQIKPAAATQPNITVLVIGETARADRFQLNGYARATNPLLSKQSGLVAFEQASSCGTATAYSVPCMLSSLARKDYQDGEAAWRDNVLDMTQRAGVQVTWLDNNSGCQEACDRVTHQQLPQNCPEGLCLDEQLIPALQQRLQQKSKQDQLIVLHMNGSHGPAYFQRYPKQYEAFTPACQTNDIAACSPSELNNVYDNTVVYTDAVLSGLLDVLKQQTQANTAFLYASDHGESLGENGLYLHAAPYAIAPEAQTHIPMLWWANDDFYAAHHVNPTCLAHMAQQQAVSHDNIFHVLLGSLFVQTKEYDKTLDWSNVCHGV